MEQIERVVIHSAGGLERLTIERHPCPEPGERDVLIDVSATGVNYADVIVRMGLYSSAKEYVGWPITPGFEVAGTVREVGASVTRVSVGDRVFAGTRFGGYTSVLSVHEDQVFPLSDALSFEEGAGMVAVYLTAWFAFHFLAHPREGDRVLIHSAAGGVGSAMAQMAKRIGCEVTGVVGRAEKVDDAERAGCDHVIDKSSENLWRRAEAISPRGFDVICDANGVATLRSSYNHLRPAGKLVVYGFATMMSKGKDKPNYLKLAADYLRTPRFNPLDMTDGSRSVLAFNLSYLFDRLDLLHEAMGDIVRWLEAGEIKPPQVTTFAMRDVAQAHRFIESGKSTGKLILLP